MRWIRGASVGIRVMCFDEITTDRLAERILCVRRTCLQDLVRRARWISWRLESCVALFVLVAVHASPNPQLEETCHAFRQVRKRSAVDDPSWGSCRRSRGLADSTGRITPIAR